MIASTKVLWALGAASFVALLLFGVGVLRNQNLVYWYLPYNLLLAFIPLLLALWLQRVVRLKKWNHWQSLLLLAAWLLFLPNSFYIVTDFIHLFDVPTVDIVQDIVMLMQFSVVGLLVGFYSVGLLHAIYLPVLKQKAWYFVGGVLFLCSTAIYLGRELRWNSWDIVVNPLGLFGDVLTVFTHPLHFANAFYMTLSFFVMLASLYGVFWSGWERHLPSRRP